MSDQLASMIQSPRGDAAPLVPRSVPSNAKAPATITVTEALNDIHRQQDMIKSALDRLISDATTLRAQM